MKKMALFFVGMIAVLSLSACTPTPLPAETTQVPPETTETSDGKLDKTPDPNAPVLDLVNIYTPNADATGLVANLEGIESLDAQSLVKVLIAGGVLEQGTTVNSFDIKGGEKPGPGVDPSKVGGGERVGTLDLSKIPTSGTAGEQVVLGSIGNTFIENFELDKLKLLVNGKNYSSGHIKQGDGDYLTFISDYEKIKK